VRVRTAPRRFQRLVVPARRQRSVAANVATALAAGAAARVAFGPAYRARSAGFMNTIVLSAPAVARGYSYDQDVGELFDAIGRLQQAALLPAVGEDLDAINALVSQLPATLAALRSRGYVHQRQLEGQVTGLAERWDGIYDGLADALYARQTELVEAANRLLDMVDRLYDPNAGRGTVEACWTGVRALQSQIEAAYRGLHGQYDDLGSQLEAVEAELARLSWTMDQVEAAPFALLAGEGPLRAATVRWLRGSDQDGRPGLLFLTDQRLLFVYQEEVVTERFLFITLKRELIQDLEFEVPVRAVTAVETARESAGMLGLKSVPALDVRLDASAPLPAARWLLPRDDAAAWVALIGRARTGDVDAGRTGDAARAAEALDAARRQAPAQCPNCSAPLDLPAARGATSITCRYCGTTVPL
jgi:hypothetical protein